MVASQENHRPSAPENTSCRIQKDQKESSKDTNTDKC